MWVQNIDGNIPIGQAPKEDKIGAYNPHFAGILIDDAKRILTRSCWVSIPCNASRSLQFGQKHLALPCIEGLREQAILVTQ